MSVVDELLDSNRRHASTFVNYGGPAEPSLRVTVVTCMDARIDVLDVLGLQLGQAHILRNAGGIVTDDVLRSLLLSQRLLGTREVVLIHHTGCGLLMFRDEELAAEVEGDTGVRPPFPLGAITSLEDSVRTSMATVRDCAFLPSTDKVRGFVYDLATGRLHEVC